MSDTPPSLSVYKDRVSSEEKEGSLNVEPAEWKQIWTGTVFKITSDDTV